MKQYSLKFYNLRDLEQMASMLEEHVTAWQVNYIKGEDYFKFTFKTKLSFATVADLLKDYSYIGTLSEDL